MDFWECAMENLVTFKNFWRKKNVLVTGHTGFKGGWLSLWLDKIGANVSGYALQPNKENAFYNLVYADGFVGPELFSDINNLKELSEFIKSQKPSVIFHLAAQPLVRKSYLDPLETFKTNSMGVVCLLEAIRHSGIEPTILNITTDKVYKINESNLAYQENDPLGGNDPYSASKSCSEIITHSYRKTFFQETAIKVATVRAGNVIGGGDMSKDRLVPDFFRSLLTNNPITIRNPKATRPWQHILEPISGYINLAEKLSQENGNKYEGSWNFGPTNGVYDVGEIITKLSKMCGAKEFKELENLNMLETQSLNLDSSKAIKKLDWQPKLKIDEALKLTYDWFSESLNQQDMREFSLQQITDYQINA